MGDVGWQGVGNAIRLRMRRQTPLKTLGLRRSPQGTSGAGRRAAGAVVEDFFPGQLDSGPRPRSAIREDPRMTAASAVARALCTGALMSLLPAAAPAARGADLVAGAATVSVTPDRPVALWGQMHTRISTGVASPVTATVLLLESRDGDRSLGTTTFVACDLVAIPDDALAAIRRKVAAAIAGFPVERIVASATHTHTAPVLLEGVYDIPAGGVMQPADYVDFFATRVAEGIRTAWEGRRPCTIGWGMGHAVVAQNRRSVYADNTAVMYGATDKPEFRMIEGYEDHALDALFVWDLEGRLLATTILVACPAQEVEGNGQIDADFWHPVREALRAEHGADLHVLAWTGAAGDQSPHLMFRKGAEERMRRLRGVSRLEEIAARIVAGWKEALHGAAQEKLASVPLEHRFDRVTLPRRVVSEREAELAKEKIRELSGSPGNATLLWWHGGVVERWERQQSGDATPFTTEVHVVRIGDVAVATNQFELYTDFGIAIQARSPALQTFVVQLAGPGTYLPSARAARGGGYSATPESNEVGPEAGQVLVDHTVSVLRTLFEPPAPAR